MPLRTFLLQHIPFKICGDLHESVNVDELLFSQKHLQMICLSNTVICSIIIVMTYTM